MSTQRLHSRRRRLGLAAACAALLGMAAPTALVSPARAAPAAPAARAVAADTSNCVATVNITAQWGTGLVAQVTLRNVGTTTWHGWQAIITMPPGWQITAIWSSSATVSGNTVVFTGTATVPPGGTVTFGFVATGTGSPGPIFATCTGF